jgi:zinc transporter ZupT
MTVSSTTVAYRDDLMRRRAADLDESRLSKAFTASPWLAPAFLVTALTLAGALSFMFGYLVEQPSVRIDTSGFIITAGLFVGALAIERMTELLIAPWVGDIHGKAGRTVVIGSVTAVLGVITAGSLGLYLLEILTSGTIHTGPNTDNDLIRSIDILVTGMAIAGGTKPLHDLLSSLEKRTKKAKDDSAENSADIARITLPPVAETTGSTKGVEGTTITPTPYRQLVTVTESAESSASAPALGKRIDAITAGVSGDHCNASASFCDGVIHPRVFLGLELSE